LNEIGKKSNGFFAKEKNRAGMDSQIGVRAHYINVRHTSYYRILALNMKRERYAIS